MSECDDFEARVAELEERLEAFENLVEIRGADGPAEAGLGDIWLAGVPVGKLLKTVDERSRETENRVQDLAAGEVDATALTGVESEHQLAIQRRVAERKAGEEVSPVNLHRATFVWEEFYERAVADQGYWKLESPQVKNILDGNDLNTNPNTVKRVMQQLAKHTGPSDDPTSEENLIQFKKGTDKNSLVADRDDWAEWAASLEQDVGTPDDASEQEVEGPDESERTADATTKADAEVSALMAAEAVTDDSADPVDDDITTTPEVGD